MIVATKVVADNTDGSSDCPKTFTVRDIHMILGSLLLAGRGGDEIAVHTSQVPTENQTRLEPIVILSVEYSNRKTEVWISDSSDVH